MNSYIKAISLLFALALCYPAMARQGVIELRAQVVSQSDGQPIQGATVRSSVGQTMSDEKGFFTVIYSGNDPILNVSALGYTAKRITFSRYPDTMVLIQLTPTRTLVDEVVVSTGYYSVPVERATGSFSFVEEEDIKGQPGINILHRLENQVPGMQFIRKDSQEGDEEPEIRVRGVATIHSDRSPLIVVDNFPFNGNIESIDPATVANVTVLKDAAAASIWGAKAGNGVIVITTKKGSVSDSPRYGIRLNTSLTEKRDLHKSKSFISSSDHIEMERILFDRRHYAENNWTPLSPAVELFIAERDGRINRNEMEAALDELRSYDYRADAEKYFFQTPVNTEFSGNVSGGTDVYRYFLSTGVRHNQAMHRGVHSTRYTVSTSNTIRLNKVISLDIGMNYSRSDNSDNSATVNDLTFGSFQAPAPYTRFVDKAGQPIPITKGVRTLWLESEAAKRFGDWTYNPLVDKNEIDKSTLAQDIRLSGRLSIDFSQHTNASAQYQYESSTTDQYTHYYKNSFFNRHLVNQYTQLDGSMPFPNAGAQTTNGEQIVGHNLRTQVNYSKGFTKLDLYVHGLAGIEAGQTKDNSSRTTLYGFNPETYVVQSNIDNINRFPTYPRGNNTLLPRHLFVYNEAINRYVSAFANASLTFKNRYLVSGSVRWDGSNLYGVKANQKGVPLYSLGIGWHLDKEAFFNSELMDQLRLRMTFGYSGNTNQNSSANTVITYGVDRTTNLPRTLIWKLGNPWLRWERVKTLNFGIDASLLKNSLYISLDGYQKAGMDLIGNVYTDITTGWDSENDLLPFLMNYANIRTSGIDVNASSSYSIGKVYFSSKLQITYVENKVTNYFGNIGIATNLQYTTHSAPPVSGKSFDQMYSVPWFGLSNENGLIQVPDEDGKLSTENSAYNSFVRDLALEDLIPTGISTPRLQGVLSQSLNFGKWSLNLSALFKAGYNFRKPSLNYNRLITSWEGHNDYPKRWQNPGDELVTNIPAFPTTNNSTRDMIYQGSEIFIENGSHVRLHDVRLSRNISFGSKWQVSHARMFVYSRNLGVLWSASKSGLDPDSPSLTYPKAKSISIGIELNF